MRNIARMAKVCMVAAALLLTSCGDKPADDPGKKGRKPETKGKAAKIETKGEIGVTCMDLTNPFFKLISNVMTEEAAKVGYEVISADGNNDPAKQNSQLTDFVAQGVDAIFLNPVDSKAAGEGVKKAHAAGIPVFTFDVQVTAPASSGQTEVVNRASVSSTEDPGPYADDATDVGPGHAAPMEAADRRRSRCRVRDGDACLPLRQAPTP